MQFYTDIEARKRALLEKIENKDFFLNEDETLLIEHFPEIKKVSFNVLLGGKEVWTDAAIQYFNNNIGAEDIETLNDNHFYYFALALIDKGDLYNLEELVMYIEKRQEVYHYLMEKLKDPNYKVGKEFGTFAATAMIEVGRYDLLSLLPRGYHDAPQLSQEVLKDVLSHYPYSFSNLCLPMDKELVDEARKNYSSLNVYELFGQFSNNPEEIFPLLKEKLLNESVDLSYPLDERIDVSNFYNLLTEEEKKVFKRKMIFLNLSWYFQHTSDIEVRRDISLIAQSLRNHFIKYGDIRKYSQILLFNKEVLDVLLDKKEIGLVLSSPLAEEYVPIILERINSKEIRSLRTVDTTVLVNLCKKSSDFLRAILQNGIVSAFDLSALMKDDNLSVIIQEEIEQKHAVVELDEISIEQLKYFICCGNIEILLYNISKISIDLRKEKFVLTEEECTQLIEGLKDKLSLQDKFLRLASSLVFSNPSVLEFYLHSSSIILEKVIDYINHHEELSFLYTDSLFHKVKEYYAEKYDLSIEQLNLLESSFGPTIIRYMENETILKIVKLSSKKLDRLVGLFPKVNYDMSNVETMYDSLKQYAFSKEHTNIVNIFVRIKHSVEDDNLDFLKDLEELVSIMDNKFYKYYEKKNPTLVNACKESPIEFLKNLISQIKSTDPETKEQTLRILHQITDYYIAIKREEYRKEYRMFEDLTLPYTFDEKDLEKKLLFPVYGERKYYRNPITGEIELIAEEVVRELASLGLDSALIHDAIDYYVERKEPVNSDLNAIKKNLRFIIPAMQRAMRKCLPKGVLEEFTIELDQAGEIKRNYFVPKSNLDIYQLLSSLRLDVLEQNLLEDNPTNNRIYQSLYATMKKHKLHVIPDCFRSLLESDSIQISSDMTNISSFISYYYQVYETERKRLESQGKDSSNLMLSATNILLNASVLSGVSTVYSQILGSEDAKLIKVNPGPNSAIYKIIGDSRLKESVDWTIKNFKRMGVSIPTFIEDVSLNENQLLRVVVGNFTHPSNITHGERTSACMRIGGIGETLFNFCLEDENGFHIRFEDAKTGEYISRVSGFRNGNTVFLNELRNSCNQILYSDEDVIEACTRVAELLIEKSKDSTCPIENVVVAKAYATTNMQEVNLGIIDNKKGLKKFYSDIQNSGIVLATTGSPYTTINMDKSHVPTYLPAREKTYVGTDLVKLMDMMNRVHSIKKVLSGENYEYIEPLSFEQDIVYGIANQDWYICMDSLGNIFEEIISIDKRAEEELEVARKMIAEYIPEKKEEDNYQY